MKVLCPLSIRKADENFLACCVYADRGYKNFNQLRYNIFRVNSLYARDAQYNNQLLPIHYPNFSYYISTKDTAL